MARRQDDAPDDAPARRPERERGLAQRVGDERQHATHRDSVGEPATQRSLIRTTLNE